MYRRIADHRVSHRARSGNMLAGVAAIALAGCTSPGLSVHESAIRGGATDGGDPAVAALSVLGLYSYCTATLISRHTLLTAGHCDLSGMEAEFGGNADEPMQSIDVTKVVVHPMYTAEGKPYDLAVMKLASDPVGIAPVLLNDAPLGASDVGQMIRHVGFGVTDDGTGDGGGTKRTVRYALNRIDGMLVYSGAPGEQSCVGDSGGPGLMTLPGQTAEILVSVVSDGPDCQLSQDGWDDRIDLAKDWIVQTVSAWDAPPSFGAVGTGDTGGSGGGDGTGGSGGTGGSNASGGPTGSDGGVAVAGLGGCAATPAAGGWALCLLGALIIARRRRSARA